MRRFKWKRVEYNLFGIIHSKGVAQPRILKFCGRAIGMRKDGACFWVAYDLPFIWPKKFQWTGEARKRLDTYLDTQCKCIAGAVEQKRNASINGLESFSDVLTQPNVTCDFHRDLIVRWNREDNHRLGFQTATNDYDRTQNKGLPSPGKSQGPIDQLEVVNADYLWVRKWYKDGLLRCLICRQTQSPAEYGNIFIRKHSFCGETRAQQKPYLERYHPALPPGEGFDEIDRLVRDAERQGKTINA